MIITREQLKNFKEGLPKRLTIDGQTKEYPSYLIPLKYLYYNNLNGRIATYIEEYNDKTDNEDLNELLKNDFDKYNDLIAGFIKKSSNDNETSFKKTKNDIEAKGQQNPGVILSDGRIIDGNRRFTAIRELYKEKGNDKFAYFEAAYLDAPEEDDKDGWKRIKTLELNLQFNVDEKKDYNRIDFLVSFYRDTIDPSTRMFDKKQYCYASGITLGEYDKNANIIRIMLDYLEWRNKPKAFYILKNEKLDGPIEDIAANTKKMNDEEWASIKDYVYHYMTHVQSGDRTRDIRELVKSAKAKGSLFQRYKEPIDTPEMMTKLAKAVANKDSKITTPDESRKSKEIQAEIQKKLIDAFETAKYQNKIEIANNEPIKLLEDAINKIKKIDIAIIKNMAQDQKNSINSILSDLEKTLIGIRKAIENE